MKQLGLIITVLIFCFIGYSQPYGNEWINYNQRYLKIPITSDGLYRVNYSELNQAFANIGVTLSSIDPRAIQVFGRGKENFIFIDGESDGKFDSTDYLIFYGKGNDGWFDKGLYIKPEYQFNPFYSLISDTAWYYVTFSTSPSGKRFEQVSNVNFAGKTVAPYIYKYSFNQQINEYNEGIKDGAGVSSPLYQEGEGWGVASFFSGKIRIYELKCRYPKTTSGTPLPLVYTNTVSKSNAAGSPNHGLYIQIGPRIGGSKTNLVDTSYTGYKMIKHKFTIPLNYISSSTLIHFEKKPLTPEPPSDFQSTAFVQIKYAHTMQINAYNSLDFSVLSNTDTTYLQFTGAKNGYFPYAFDLEKGWMCRAVQTGSNLEILIPPGKERPIAISKNIEVITSILPSYSQQKGKGFITDYTSLNTDSAFLIITNKKLWSSALQYQNYRNLKGANAILVDVEDLYEQFSYGIKKHPLAIRNFLNYQIDKGNNTPAHLFLLGKSVKENITRQYKNNNYINILPTIGVPPADNVFSTSLDNVSFLQKIPTGRLAAFNNQTALNYLDKIIDFEKELNKNSPLIEDKAWRKRGIHFAGGADINQQKIFGSYLENYEYSWENVKLGGNIKTFKRFTSGAVQSISFDSVKYWIDDGVLLLSFFGHGSGGQLGINIGEPSDYNNAGKYPFFIANSCNVGDFHLPNTTASTVNEKWVLAPKGGVIGFIATTSAGFASPLNTWSSSFFRKYTNELYGESIGRIMQSTVSNVQGQSDFVNRACMEMNLHGDPSIRYYKKTKPDFAIRKKDITAPSFVSVDERIVSISYTIHNIGIGVDTLIPIQLKRTFPSGKDTIYTDTIKGIHNTYSSTISILINDQKSVGENKFVLQIDPENSIDEIYPFVNNSTPEIRVNVTSNDLIPVFPSNYSIQPTSNLMLSASTANPNALSRNYKFEIDVSDSFNSAQKKSGEVVSKGGLVQWNPNLGLVPDSTVFFWRCTPFDGIAANNKWREFSFQYISNQTGWSQYVFNQFKNNTFQDLKYDKANQKFEFVRGKSNIQAFNQGNPSSSAEYNSIKWAINGVQQGRVSICRGYQSMFISVIDPRTLIAWETRWKDNGVIINPDKNFGNINDFSKSVCPPKDKRFQFIISDSAMMDSMIWMINQMVPDSFYLLIMSANNGQFQNSNFWKDRHYRAFEDLGADSIRYLNNDVPYILLAQKGNKKKAIEVIGSNRKAGISLSEFVDSKQEFSNMSSTTITNSVNYKSLYWNYTTQNIEDSIILTLKGKDKTGKKLELLKINNNTFSIADIKSQIPNINEMEDLQLIADFKDSLSQGAPQLKYWMLLSEEALELALHPKYRIFFHNDTLTQGEDMKLEIGLKNLSSSNADSITVRFVVLDSRGNVSKSKLQKTAPLPANDSLIIKYTHNTTELSGAYILILDVNPEDTLWQAEGYHFNNVNSFPFYVKGDKTNPLLDVTFDGVHILDGDIVSARPEIQISLADENIYKPITDTSSFEIYLKYPNANKKRVYFNSLSSEYEIEFIAANGEENKAEIRFNPKLMQDGKYVLEVEAKDASQNRSGNNKYKSSFEVINKSTVTEILNYPNPFSTSTKFVFTLTGYQIPDYFRIQILTATGRVVREIDRYELGNLHIGRNITDYAWDGRDQFGDQLANGVYFYRVIIKIGNEEIEKRNTAADSYFKKGFGKMYLMR